MKDNMPHTNTTNIENTKRYNMIFESVKTKSSNFDKITKALEENQ